MKKLTSKKGFTLVEMLVVIAIIAVLVAIIIPTVTSATNKAKAATNAANLRSLVAEATTDYLTGGGDADDATGYVTYNAFTKKFAVSDTAPKSKGIGALADNKPATVDFDDDGNIVATYDGYGIDDFTEIANNGGTLTAKSGD
jgi:type IV pilus assembly protein PilA